MWAAWSKKQSQNLMKETEPMNEFCVNLPDGNDPTSKLDDILNFTVKTRRFIV